MDAELASALAAAAAAALAALDLEVFRAAGLDELVMTGDSEKGNEEKEERLVGADHRVVTASMIVRFITTRPVVVST